VRIAILKGVSVTAGAAALAMFTYAATAQDKKAPPPKKTVACAKLKDEAACKARDDCEWVTKDKKGSCKAKPKPKPEPKAKAK
jgi:hypothetical protein